jgi:N-methylhydantoinase A
MTTFVGTDIGGTFTDLVGFDSASGSLVFGKQLTTTSDLVTAVMTCLGDVEIAADGVDVLKHGTTQVINTLLERRGARTALIATEGFSDVLEIGRAGRPVAFKLDYQRERPLVPRTLRFELSERIAADGSVVRPLLDADMESLVERIEAAGVEAIAIAFLNAYRNSEHERKAVEFFRRRLPDCYVTSGTELSRQWFEFERASTAVANAYVGPRTNGYIERFENQLTDARFHGRFYIMGSNGGVLSPQRAREQPIAMVESGPIGGGVGGAAYAQALEIERMIAFDMGGTTAKCALIEHGQFDVQSTYYVGGYDYGIPIRTPVLDIVEVGTGGGSIAHLAGEGALKVGPRSAGSEPGPVCFARGGKEPTVTDANAILGRISDGRFLDGRLRLDRQAAAAALQERVGGPMGFQSRELDTVAAGVIALSNTQMADAIKEITIERGRDARGYALFAFGGGGPLHAVELARQLHIPRVIVPPEPGNFSAIGMLFASARLDESRSIRDEIATGPVAAMQTEIASICARMSEDMQRDESAAEVVFETHVDVRFCGQRNSLKVPFPSRDGDAASLQRRYFDMYRNRFGHVDETLAIEMIGFTVTAVALTPRPEMRQLHRAGSIDSAPVQQREVFALDAGRRMGTPILNRFSLEVGTAIFGPAVIEEFGSTTVIGPTDRLEVGELGELDIAVGQR